jgi:hypothetical protein
MYIFFFSLFYQLAYKTKFTICNTILIYIIYGDRTIIAIISCDLRRRITRHFFITFVAIDYMYERLFSYYASKQAPEINDTTLSDK